MQVIFIHHSCFLVEVDEKVLIFDFFQGDRVEGFSFTGKIPTYEKDTPIYLFSSHSHRDHYDLDVLRWSNQYPNIHYIFSKDIRISPNFLKKHGIDPKVREKVLFVKPDKEYELDKIKIETLPSTDAGVAFYVSVQGVYLFHAGDLGDWRMSHVGELLNGKMKREYQHQIRKLADKPIHAAFLPMDPRLNEYQFEGVDYFLKNTQAEYIFPMHMWQNYEGIVKYKHRLTNRAMAERIIEVERENQVFLFGENYL